MRGIWVILVVAVTVRWGYAAVQYAVVGADAPILPDSVHFLSRAHQFAEALRTGTVADWAWLGPDPSVMPLFLWLLAAFDLVFGESTAIAFVVFQGAVDAVTCLVVGGIARTLDARLAGPAAWAAVFNPTMVVLSGFLLSDTIFTLACSFALLLTLRWLRSPTLGSSLSLGLVLWAAFWMRVVLAPWAIALLALFLVAQLVRRDGFRRAFAGVGLIAVLVGTGIGAIAARNAAVYDRWSLTPQTGLHFALWIVPLVKQAHDGSPYSRTAGEMLDRARLKADPAMATNPFVLSDRLLEVGADEARKLSFRAYVEAWVTGAAINLFSPAVVLVPAVMRLPRTGFYETRGGSLVEKVHNFLFASDNPIYAWLLVAGIAGVLALRACQLIGAIRLVVRSELILPLAVLVVWCGFIIAASGPIASPKYRLPIEPVFCVLLAAFVQRRGASAAPRSRPSGVAR